MNPLNPDGDANCWLSGMLIAKESKVTPDMVMDALEEINAESRPIWKPMHHAAGVCRGGFHAPL